MCPLSQAVSVIRASGMSADRVAAMFGRNMDGWPGVKITGTLSGKVTLEHMENQHFSG